MIYPNPEDALKGLRGADLERAYRAWAKRLHPDGTDGNHEAFLRLQEAYQVERSAQDSGNSDAQGQTVAEKHPGRKPRNDAFDPWESIRETGRSSPLPPLDCLFAALERWRQAGSPSARPVRSPSLGARNRRILRTVLHWGGVVDPGFTRDFAQFVRFSTGPLRTTAASRAERDARRSLEEGLDLVLRWREEGRPVTASLARERLDAAREIVDLNGLPRPEIGRIADWLTGFLPKGRKGPGGEP